MTDDEQLKKEIEEIFDREIRGIHNELTEEIMKMKSVSLAEARYIALKFMSIGIFSKNEEFYKQIQQVKTMWEL